MNLFRFLILFFLIPALRGQFSPGELSKYHEDLEGTLNCTKCHELRKKELSDGCILCHSPLKNRINAGTGFHRDKKTDCGDCHPEHNGRTFELVYWPKDISRFDHDETGYTLTGKHRALKCNQCHTGKLIKAPDIIAWATENSKFSVLDRTFLGLERKCTACHADVHRGEVTDDCSACHNTDDWHQAAKQFDHDSARFRLIGAHRNVPCEKCHKPHTTRKPAVPQLTGLVFDRCTGCHEDVHRGEVTGDCAACHDNNDWKRARQTFDHGKSRYPLTGSHSTVVCEKCHQPHSEWKPVVPQLTGLAYENCSPCHTDIHKGSYGITCERCHTTNDWKNDLKPFDHSQTSYPLRGKHTEVKCRACHTEDLKHLPSTPSCVTCHEDKHFGQFAGRADGGACESCHTVNGFVPATFSISEHQTVRFKLEGSHLAVPCVSCHKPYEPQPGVSATRFIWETVTCRMCHEDIHRGQFRDKYRNDCSICHNTILFTQLRFDHQSTDFPLDGKHENVRCEFCHKEENDNTVKFVRYYPVAHRCVDCHTLTEEFR